MFSLVFFCTYNNVGTLFRCSAVQQGYTERQTKATIHTPTDNSQSGWGVQRKNPLCRVKYMNQSSVIGCDDPWIGKSKGTENDRPEYVGKELCAPVWKLNCGVVPPLLHHLVMQIRPSLLRPSPQSGTWQVSGVEKLPGRQTDRFLDVVVSLSSSDQTSVCKCAVFD